MSSTKKVHLKRYSKKNKESAGISYWDFLTDEEICENRINISIKHRL